MIIEYDRNDRYVHAIVAVANSSLEATDKRQSLITRITQAAIVETATYAGILDEHPPSNPAWHYVSQDWYLDRACAPERICGLEPDDEVPGRMRPRSEPTRRVFVRLRRRNFT